MGKSLSKSRFIELFGDPRLNNKKLPIKKIKDFAKCIAGATPSTAESSYWDNGTIPWMSSGEVNQGRIYSTEKKITQKGYDNASTKLIPPHTVVIAMAGQGKTRGTVGVAEIELCTNQSICSVVTDDTVDVDYLYYFLKLQYEALRGASNGAAGRGGLNLKIIGDFPVIVPDLNLQKSFVKCVNQIDKSKFILQKMIEKLELLKKSRFIELFGDIKEKNKWPREKWSDVCEIINGKDFKSVEDPNGQYAVYGTGGFMAKANQYTCPENSIIIGRKGTINKPLLVKEKFWNIDTAFGVVPNITKVHYQYFYWFCKQFNFMSINKGTTLPSTTKTDLQKIEINVPPLELQLHFSHLVDQIDKSKLILQKQLEDLVGETK